VVEEAVHGGDGEATIVPRPPRRQARRRDGPSAILAAVRIRDRSRTEKEDAMKSTPQAAAESASESITQRIRGLDDWRGEKLAQVRALIHEADPDVVEEWKWMGTPVWSHDGIVCTGEHYKQVVKLTFAKGASLKDPKKLFNSSLDGNVRRAIDIREHDRIDAAAFRALFKEAVAWNREHPPKRRR
jgi:hypothetical protein